MSADHSNLALHVAEATLKTRRLPQARPAWGVLEYMLLAAAALLAILGGLR